MTDRILAMASDHGGYEMKALLKDEAVRLGWAVLDLGTDGPASVDYPDYAAGVAAAIREGRAGRGVLVCGSGIGISIAANRFPEIRAALIHDSYGARMCRQHRLDRVAAIRQSEGATGQYEDVVHFDSI
ncbi:MAG: RpiB/LacA/LacB family sugar-phosphate isomerase, partial [Alphaproteobacteria bacterium]|nr:RpiB/LacA/LacB family sugar-phosphate isomerase [Alphaproteobacteria bacterium]